MKKSSEICRLPVLSIEDGTPVEKIARLVVNPLTRGVEFLVFTCPWYETPWVLPWSGLKAVGRDLVTIRGRKDLAQVGEELRKRLVKTVDLTGAEVIDTSGRLCGSVADFEIDEASGKLEKLILGDGGELDVGSVVTLGIRTVVVEGGVEIRPKASNAFSENEFLLGKTAAVDIPDGKGTVLISAGTVVTRKEIEAAKAAGALYDLVTGVK